MVTSSVPALCRGLLSFLIFLSPPTRGNTALLQDSIKTQELTGIRKVLIERGPDENALSA